MPQHSHRFQAKDNAVITNIPSNTNFLGNTAPNLVYSGQNQNFTAMNAGSISNIGGSQPHLNMQPYLTINFCIALQGIFPSQT